MKPTSDYTCEILSVIVLFTLSALSHFWYMMIIVCIAAAIWMVIALSAHLFQYLRAMLSFDSPD